MSETKNYHLGLTDDDKTKFIEWRKIINGNKNSNMQKIDDALGEKANGSVSVSATLLASAWSGIDSPFTQELSVEGLTADQNGDIAVAHSATALQRDIARCAMLAVIGQSDGKLIIAADGELPEEDIPVSIILFG